MFRYSLKAKDSDASNAELLVARWIGHRYAIGVNSCSSAIFVSMRVAGVKVGDKVLTNAFTFTAIPSTIHNLGATPIFVESTEGFQMDIPHLEAQIAAHPDAKTILLSHFRGKLSDCDTIAMLAAKHGLVLIEDCAHAMGVTYKGKPAGRKGHLAVYSVQSDKVINAGEGGFVTTNNKGWAAKLVFLSGAYEKRYTHHLAAPVEDVELMEHEMTHQQNCSFRMTNVTGAMVCAQMPHLPRRVAEWNANGNTLLAALKPAIHTGHLVVPPEVEGAVGCFDHLVFSTPTFDQEQRNQLAMMCKSRGVALKPFGTYYNARFFKNWNFLPEGIRASMPKTEQIVRSSWDMKMPLCFNQDDWRQIGCILIEAIAEVAKLPKTDLHVAN